MNTIYDIDTDKIENSAILTMLLRANVVIREHSNIVVSISGGSDSDIILDLMERLKGYKNIKYIFIDTGLEYNATKEHLKYLESKYNISIERIKAIKPIPICCKEYGIPFLSKFVSDMLQRLQRVNFKFEDRSFDELIEEYPNSKGALTWWCNAGIPPNGFNYSMFNINYNKWLKEFLILNPPTFKISNKCCLYAKKKAANDVLQTTNADVSVVGVRKAEKGIRVRAYKNCFTYEENGIDSYRPLWWLSNTDKKYYEDFFNVEHSACYTEYGLKRTGCVGCPYNQNITDELKIMEKFEPNLYKAAINIFGPSYEYTTQYRQFCKDMKGEPKCQAKR